MHQFNLQLFGPFHLLADGRPVENFATDQARALLVYLILHQGQPLRRESLAALFWPDAPDKQARQNLRQTLSRMRRALTVNSHKPAFIATDYKTVALQNDAPLQVDVHRFCALLDACDEHRPTHPPEGDCPACQERMTAAIEFYQGELLEGFHLSASPDFDDWLTLQREQLHRRAIDTLEQLLLNSQAAGNLSALISHARALLRWEPWRENAHRALIFALALSGERDAALAQFERCKKVLAAELGVAPSAETIALYEQIAEAGSPPVLPPTELPSRSGLHNFPAELTSFIGREEELGQLKEQLQQPNCRLLTVIGPGGIGKTRLALEAARTLPAEKYPDGVYFVPLSAIHTVAQLETGLVESLGGVLRDGTSARIQLLHLLHGKRLLLLLDTFEHLMPGAELLAALLQNAEDVQILITSREALNLQAEWRLALPGLTFAPQELLEQAPASAQSPPAPLTDPAAYSAVDLFVQRATRTQPGFAPEPEDFRAIHLICGLVDGLPLAIEMAAAWLRVYNCQQIAEELAGNLDFLVSSLRDVPDRHRSMRAVFDLSWGLLAPQEQAVFAQLSVFRGAFSPDAAKAVSGCTPLDLAWLVDKSILARTAAGRYAFHNLLRQFGAERLAEDPSTQQQAEARHAAYYAGFLAARRERLRAKIATTTKTIAEIEDAFDNIRRAWQVLLAQKLFAALVPCVDTLYDYFSIRSRYRDGEEFFGGAAEARHQHLTNGREAANSQSDPLFLRLRNRHAHFLYRLGQYEEAAQLLSDPAELPLPPDDPEAIFQQFQQALIHYHLGDLDRAEEQARLALQNARQAGNHLRQADALGLLGSLALARSSYAEGRRFYEQSQALYAQMQKPDDETRLLLNLGLTVSILGEREKAEEYFRRCLPSYRQLGDREGEAFALCFLGTLLSETGRMEEANEFCRQSLAIFQAIGFRAGEARALERLGENTRRLGRLAECQEQLQQAQAIYQEIGHRLGEGAIHLALARLALQSQDWPTATVHCAEAMQTFAAVDSQWGVAAVQLILARVAIQRGQGHVANSHIHTALATATELNVADMQCDALLALAQLWAEESPATALKLCAFLVSTHLALYEIQEAARRLLLRLRATLPGEEADAAIRAGRAADLPGLVAETLAANPPSATADSPSQ